MKLFGGTTHCLAEHFLVSLLLLWRSERRFRLAGVILKKARENLAESNIVSKKADNLLTVSYEIVGKVKNEGKEKEENTQ